MNTQPRTNSQPQTNSHPTWCDQTICTAHLEDGGHDRIYSSDEGLELFRIDGDDQGGYLAANLPCHVVEVQHWPALAAALLQAHNDVMQSHTTTHNRRYSNQRDAIQTEIIEPIESGGVAKASDYDIDAIAEAVLSDSTHGYTPIVDTDTFWNIVANNQTHSEDQD